MTEFYAECVCGCGREGGGGGEQWDKPVNYKASVQCFHFPILLSKY